MPSLLFEIYEHFYPIFWDKSGMKNSVPGVQDLDKQHAWGVSVDSEYVLFGERTCGFVCKIMAKNTVVPT